MERMGCLLTKKVRVPIGSNFAKKTREIKNQYFLGRLGTLCVLCLIKVQNGRSEAERMTGPNTRSALPAGEMIERRTEKRTIKSILRSGRGD